MLRSKTISGIIQLTRHREYVISTVTTSLLGFLFAPSTLNLKMVPAMILIIIANILSIGFSFMINDIEDAEDDALNPKKKNRNPLSAGTLSYNNAYFASLVVAIIALLLYSLFSPLVFLTGLTTICVSYLYSWKKIRLKRVPIIDFVSHCLMLAGFQFIAAYFAISHEPQILNLHFVLPFLLCTSVSCYGELYNEVRDLKYDRLAGLTHTAAVIGEKYAKRLMHLFLLIGGASILLAFVFKLIPGWFAVVFGILSVLLLIKPIKQSQKKKLLDKSVDFQDPMMNVVVISLTIWILVRIFL
jgi:4-hydroxybenzoate polyprenyltransferase